MALFCRSGFTMKSVKEPLDPSSLNVREIIDRWVARSRWWATDEKRSYFRLHTTRGIIEVYRCNKRWYVSRIAD